MANTAIPRFDEPPSAGGSYTIPQFEGEIISIPGSKSVFRILTSELQSDDTIAVFTSGGALADAPGFHHHEEAHDIFMVTKGYLQLWNGDRCKVLGPGDFASIPPKIIHNPKLLGPITETFGLIHPASWLKFFRYVSESYSGILYPEGDNRNLAEIIIPKVMSAPEGEFDVHFHPGHQGAEVSEWDERDEKLPQACEPYYLKANKGPRYMLGGVMSRPFATTTQTSGKFAISSIEGSSKLAADNPFEKTQISFASTHHCFSVMEGKVEFKVAQYQPTVLTEGESLFVAKKTPFAIKFASKLGRVWSFTSGDGIESLIHSAGKPLDGYALPDQAHQFEEKALSAAMEKAGVTKV